VRRPATREWGSGPAVLLVHGLNGFKEGWGRLPGALAAAGLRAVAVDLPGFGDAPRLRRTTPQAMARAIEQLLAELAPAGLVAHSLGTQVAMLAADAHPERVRGLALLAPWVLGRRPRFPPRRISDVLQLPLVGRPLARLLIARARRSPERRRAAFLTTVGDPSSLTGDPAMAALLEEASARLLRADVRAMADWGASGLGLDVRPLAGRIARPALVVAGTLDRVTLPSGARWLADALPAGRLLSLPGVGHFPHLEAPDRVAAAVAAHLAERG
jgi:pimeloyl-ACP methyl ester carboxylesterase